MLKILFVCLGNICRSPLAEAIFDDLVAKKNLQKKFTSDSAGTGSYHVGNDPDPRSIAVAGENNVPIEHKARQFEPKDYDRFDYIIAMDHSNLHNIVQTTGYKHEGLFLMRAFDEQKTSEEVPDPYFGGKSGFREVFEILRRSNENFIKFLTEKHQL